MFIVLIIFAAIIAAVYPFTNSGRNETALSYYEDSPWEIINRQYASGEIDRDELERRRALLKGEPIDSKEGGME